ncbi:MAG: glutamine--fructose-6-phosphate transaminase (isomerizing) [Deltaproteobacteria bacterium]|nr:glutamine--fructose-6-phosphate transaminase (isomerizing) [Deltaproteobacteria bacterium]
MCGIIGYSGPQEAVEVLLEGLKRLEYRGYDSAGISILKDGQFDTRRTVGKLDNLRAKLGQDLPQGQMGIGHTRWATHGRPSDTNAHPHQAGDIVLIHNGIIENYAELRRDLAAEGRTFASETDTEVVAHLIDHIWHQEGDFLTAVRRALDRLKGSWALLIMNRQAPQTIIAARKESPLIVGRGQGETFFASDVPAFLNHTNQVIFLDDGDLVLLEGQNLTVFDRQGQAQDRPLKTINWSPAMAEKAGYKHFMLKEIFEQPRAIIDTFRGRILPDESRVVLDETGLSDEELSAFKRIFIVACGTSFHASLVGKFMIETLAKIPVEVDLASEFKDRDPLVGPGNLVIFISQSGETFDTMGAMREAKAKGARLLAVCNVVGSSLARECDGVIYTHAGPEIGVASTKAFTTQLTVLYLLALHLGRLKGLLDGQALAGLIDDLVRLPGQVEEALEMDSQIKAVAKKLFQADNFLYLGRGLVYPLALEGALKLKEISYIHAEGYPAGEMKHGPIALIDDQMPVVVLIPADKTRDKILSNVEEVRAREGRLIALGQGLDQEFEAEAALNLPLASQLLNPILLAVPLQLLAYHVAVIRGTDVDQPRNLAKSVTVP